MSTAHVVCRSVRDCAVMLDSTAGAELGDPYTAPPPERPFVEEIKRSPGRLKIAMMRKDHLGAALHPECVAAVEKSGKLCESLGHVVEEAYPDLDFEELGPSIRVIMSTNTARNLSKRWQVLGRAPDAKDVEAVTWLVFERGLTISGVAYVEAIAAIHAAGGVAVWAHPFWDVDAAPAVLETIDRFAALGLDGVEAFYPSHDAEQTALIAARCAERDMLTTGSADFHGPAHPIFNRFRAFELHGLEPRLGPIAG